MRSLTLFLALSGLAWAAPTVTKVKLMRDAAGKAGAEVAYFKPGDRRHHFQARFQDTTLGQTRLRWVFTGVETSAGNNLKVKELNLTGLAVNESNCDVSLPRDWPFGNYRGDIFVNEQKVKSFTYVVSPSPDELKSTGSGLFRDNGKGGEGAAVKQFSTKDRNLHFEVGVNGFLMGKAKVRWTYVALKTTAGNDRVIVSEEKDLSNFKGNTLLGNCSLPRDWPKGTYEVRLEINGRKLTTVPFRVE